MNKTKGLLFLLLSICHLAVAQQVKVYDKTTLQPLPGVTITATFNNSGIQTDATGKGDLSLLNIQAGSIKFNLIGYQPLLLTPAQVKAYSYEVPLTQQSHNLGEVVVSASRFTNLQKLVPQQVEVLTAKDLNFMSQPTTADVIQHSGKVLVQKSQLGGGSPIIRGFEANKVLLVVDGVRMNNAIYRGGHLQNIITLDNSMLERAEVVFGPGSVIYGSDALGGVLHFHTLKPKLSETAGKALAKGSAFTRYATAASEKIVHAQVNYGRSRWASLTSFTVSDFDDLRQGKNRNSAYGDLGIRSFYAARVADKDSMLFNPNPNVQIYSGYRQYDALQKVLFQPKRNISHILNLQLSTSTDIPRYDRLSELSGNKLKFAEWYYGPQKRLLAAYSFANITPTSIYDEIKLTAAYQWLEESRYNRKFGQNNLSHQEEHVQVYTLNADISKQIKAHRLQYGAEATYNSIVSEAYLKHIVTGNITPRSTRYPDVGSSMHSAAAYLTNTWNAQPWLVLNQGLRYTYTGLDAQFDDKSFFPFLTDELKQRNQALSGNLGAVILPGNGWRIALLGSSGFRAPNIDDLSKVFDSTPGTVIVPNPKLNPEYTYNLEATVSKTLQDRIHMEIVGYRTWYRNAITIQPFLLNGQDSVVYEGLKSLVTANQNAGKANLYGYSASLKADVNKTISLSSALNYTYGRIQQAEGDTPLDHIPPIFGRTSLNLQLKRFRAEAFALYNGAKELKDYNANGEDNLQYATPNGLPSWYTLNLRTAYQFTPNLQMQAALENITDRYYRVFASGISAPGRNLVITLRGSF